MRVTELSVILSLEFIQAEKKKKKKKLQWFLEIVMFVCKRLFPCGIDEFRFSYSSYIR